MSIGRNEPCPCGSGKKYKKCCLNQDRYASATQILGDLKNQLSDQVFDNLEDAQAFIGQRVNQINHGGHPDFLGLTPDQMHSILHRPFDSPNIATFPTYLKNEPKAPIIAMAKHMSSAMGRKSLRATINGNLPRQLSRDLANTYLEDDPEAAQYLRNIQSEEEFPVLLHFRWVMHYAGFLDIKKTVFKLTPEFHELQQRSGFKEIYPRLFRAYWEKINWFFSDYGKEYPILQSAMLFHLFLYKKLGRQPLLAEAYFEYINSAFPQIVDVEGGSRKELCEIYGRVIAYRWAHLFGLMVYTPDAMGKTTPLLDDLVRFAPPVQRLLRQTK